MKKLICSILSLTIILLSTSCSGSPKTPSEQSSETSASTVTSEPSRSSDDTEETTAAKEPDAQESYTITGDHEFQDNVFPPFYLENYGESTRNAFYALCTAALNGEDSFVCDDMHAVETAHMLTMYLMPVCYYYVTLGYCNEEKGEPVPLEYSIPHDEYMEKVREFKQETVNILDATCKPGYTDLEKALSIFEYFAEYGKYDNDLNIHTGYEVIMDKLGICQDYARAYTFLLAQVGIDSFTCSDVMAQFSGENVDFHEWNLVMIDGRYYHVDPTMALEGKGTFAIEAFGLTDEMRHEVLNTDVQNWVYAWNVRNKGGRYTVTDDRFAPIALVGCQNYSIDYDNDVIKLTTYDSKDIEFNYSDLSGRPTPTPVPDKSELKGEEAAKIEHGFNPHVYGSFYEEQYGESTKTAFFAFCDAVLSGADSFDCPDSGTFATICNNIAPALMPLVAYVDVDKCSVADGKAHLEYKMPHDEYMNTVEEFKSIIGSITDDCFREGYNDYANALSLYEFFGKTYQYTTLEDDDPTLSTANLFFEHYGSADDMANACVYLFAQAGMEAIPVSAPNRDSYYLGYEDVTSSWIIVDLNGEYYDINPYFVANDPSNSLYYFGTDGGEFVSKEMKYGNLTLEDASKYQTNKRFEHAFDRVYDYTINYEEGKIYGYTNEDDYYEDKLTEIMDFKSDDITISEPD